MSQLNHITPNMVPRPTGAARQDIDEIYRYLFKLVGDLECRLADLDRRLRELEQSGQKSGQRSRPTRSNQTGG